MTATDLKILIFTPDAALGRAAETAALSLGALPLVVGPGAQEPELSLGPLALLDIRVGEPLRTQVFRKVEHVVVLGPRGDTREILEALRAGAADYLAFDSSSAELEEAINRLAGREGEVVAYLQLEERGTPPRRVPLRGKLVTIGRDPSNDLCLDSAVVSRFHSKVLRRGGEHFIVDCSSRHGTFVNDALVTEAPLREGSKIRFGTVGAPTATYQRSQELQPSAPAEGLAVDPAQMESNQEMRDIAALVDTFLKLNGDLLLEDVLQIVVARSIELADADRGLILLVERHVDAQETSTQDEEAPAETGNEPQELALAMARDRAGNPLGGERLMISKKIPGDVLQTGTGVILEDLLAPGSVTDHPSTIEIGVRSAMCVPLRVRRSRPGQRANPVLGVLYVDSTSRKRPFSQKLLGALESLASEAAQAIYNSQLYEEHLAKRELDKEMRIARNIQKRLLPPSSYRSGWVELHGSSQASREVGGDLLDYYPRGEHQINLLLGDVSGKGIPAAMISSMLDGIFYGLGAQAQGVPDLGQAARELNRYLVSKSGEERFVSAIFGALSSTGKLTYVNAGHNPPICARAAGHLEILREHGMVLGMLEEAEYRPLEVQFLPGDVLVLYSDGITEARSRGGERFGLDRLQKVVLEQSQRSAREIHDSILSALARFAAGEPRGDDATLMVVKLLKH